MSTRMYAIVTAGLLAMGSPLAVKAQTQAAQGLTAAMTPARYFACQITLQRETIAGLRQVAAVTSRNGTQHERNLAAERSRQKVDAAGTRCGARPSALAAYAQRERGAIERWLAQHPETQAQLDALGAQLDALSDASAPPTVAGDSQ